MAIFQHSTVIPASQQELFDHLFHSENWENGVPPVLSAELIDKQPIRIGTILKWRVSRFGVSHVWLLRVSDFIPNNLVILTQSIGFFDRWVHTQTLKEHGDGQTLLTDIIEYEMPLGILGRLGDDLFFRKDLKNLIEARHESIAKEFNV